MLRPETTPIAARSFATLSAAGKAQALACQPSDSLRELRASVDRIPSNQTVSWDLVELYAACGGELDRRGEAR